MNPSRSPPRDEEEDGEGVRDASGKVSGMVPIRFARTQFYAFAQVCGHFRMARYQARPRLGYDPARAYNHDRGPTLGNQAQMAVKLIDYAAMPLEKLYAAYRTCYSSESPAEIWEKIRSEKIGHDRIRQFIAERLKTGHASPLE